MSINTAKIYSLLGSNNSLAPLLVKDSFSSLGMVTGSYVTGKEEGFDRLIDEVGTEIVWLGGVPAYKWLFDKTVFKLAGLDSKFDARNLKNKDIFQKTIDYAPDDKIKKSIKEIENKQQLFKKLAASKFLVSTSLAIASYIILTKLKQKYTEKQIKKHLINEFNAQKAQANQLNPEDETKTQTTSPTFKSLGSIAENLAYNSVKNMWIVDGAITTERLADSRSPQEFFGYAVKEGFSLCFLYYAGGKIQSLLENRALKKHDRSIALESTILEDNYIKKIFSDGSIKASFEMFDKIKPSSLKDSKTRKDALELYDFLHKNPENAIVKTAKQAKLITSYKGTDKIDTRAYIDLEEIEKLKNSLEELYSQYTSSRKNGESTEKFFKSLKNLKRGAIITNIGSCIFALGVLAPTIMLVKRKLFDKDSEFQTKREIRESLIREGIIG